MQLRATSMRAFSGLLAGALCLVPVSGAAQARPSTAADIALVGGTAIDPGTGTPVPNATVLVRGGRIVSVTPGADAPGSARTIDVSGRYIVPGLIDAHVHVSSPEAARRALRSGVTTARSMGVSHFADVGLRELQRQGAIEAPELLAAGYHVRPRPAIQLFLDEPALADLLDGDVRGGQALGRVVRTMLDRGVDFVKVNATERAGLPETDPRKPFYDEAELRTLVEAARAAGVPVAAHAHGDEGGAAAVAAGVRSIEHGTYLSERTLRSMAEQSTFLVPTIAVVRDLTLPGGDYDDAVLQVRGRHMLPRVRETAAAAHRLGVKVVAATDTGYGPESVLRLSHELIELVDTGLPALEAMRAATTTAAELLGIDERVGRVAEGYEADLLVLDRDPLADIGAYQDVLFVMSDGRIVLDRLAF